jgi:hypothetical protein
MIEFLDPFPEYIDEWYIMRVVINGTVRNVRTDNKQHQDIIDSLLETDKKLTGATVRIDKYGCFDIVKHSPQDDFFDIMGGRTEV